MRRLKQRVMTLLLVLALLTAGCAPAAETETPQPEDRPSAAGTAEPEAAPAGEEIAASPDPDNLPEKERSPAEDAPGAAASAEPPAPAEAGQTASEPSAAPGTLRVEGTRLVDAEGNPVQLRGVSTHGIAWYPDYVNADCFQELRQWGANVVRLAMYTAESGGYCTGGDQESLKALIRDGVQYAADAGMYAIVDWHILSDGDPNTYLDEAKDFFDEMAETFAEQDHVLYEICNEPNGGTDWSRIKSYAQEIIPVIRAHDEDAVILVGTPNWSQYVDQAAADPIAGYDNIMYTLHFYAATHREDLRQKMTDAIDAGLPIFVTEYGICDASGGGAIDEAQADKWVEALDRYGISYVAWNLSNKDETSAMLKASCGKISGFTSDDLSGAGKWVCTMLGGGTPSGSAPPAAGQDGSGGSEHRASGTETVTAAGADLSLAVTEVNRWEENGKTVRQYTVTVTNISGRACTSWTAELTFDGDITLSDGWNGDYTVSGRTLAIASKDYNGALAAGASAGDVGFIVAGGAVTGG